MRQTHKTKLHDVLRLQDEMIDDLFNLMMEADDFKDWPEVPMLAYDLSIEDIN